MVRNGSIALGVGLVVLWIVGLSNHDVRWMAWLDLCAAIIAFIGANVSEQTSRTMRIGGPVALGLGLFGLWIGGVVTGTSVGLAWANFGFGVAFFVLGAMEGIGRTVEVPGADLRRPI
jgi:hypothetical protein